MPCLLRFLYMFDLREYKRFKNIQLRICGKRISYNEIPVLKFVKYAGKSKLIVVHDAKIIENE